MSTSQARKLRKGCVTKRPFVSHESASSWLQRVKKPEDKRLHVYHCEFCGWFHLGHTSKKWLRFRR